MTDTEGGNEGKEKEVRGPGPRLDIKSEKTVGELLLAARESAGLSIEAVSLETKIPRKSIEYLETDNFEALPAKVYVRGFLRTYAKVIGLDEQQVLGKFELQTGQTHTSRGDLWEVEETVVEEEVASPHLFRKFVLPVIVAVLVIAAIIWAVSRMSGEDGSPPRDMPAAADSAVEAEAAGEAEAPGDGGESTGPETSSAEDEGGLQGRSETAALIEEERPRPAAEQQASGALPDDMSLRLIADEGDTTWFDLVLYNTTSAGTDSVLRDFILFPGDVEVLTANDAFFFKTIGNAGGFTIELDGRRLPPLGRDGVVRRNLRITRDGIAQR